MIFYSKLTLKIFLIVIFVKHSLKQSFMFFANVSMLILFWKNWLRLFKISMISISRSQFLIFLEIGSILVLHISFVKYHDIYVCKFQNKKPNLTSLKVLTKGNRDAKYLIAKRGVQTLFCPLQKPCKTLRGYCTPDQFFDCLCIVFKNCNTLVTSKICFL